MSDCSAWTFRAWVARRIGRDVDDEVKAVKRLIAVYRGHETMWYYLSLLVWQEQSKREDAIGFARSIQDGTYDGTSTPFH